ncbi:hypothetical protein SUNI508_13727 [Seiridium unicorne]|uniref:Uncharacterized protein n=1 Tax=Seiridium unicorne TaxID=138068 RepID=A0ABR2VCT4_9PEZI
MAQASITTMSMPPGPLAQPAAVTADELLEMQEYDRIVRFRDSILSGSHPRIKVPVPAAARVASSQRVTPQQNSATANSSSQKSQSGFASSNFHSFNANSQQPAVAMSAAAPSTAGSSKPLTSGTAQIDPLLLTKSEELIKAELQLQRQRLERTLREEIDTQRAANKSIEQASDFDLSDILAKALTLVQATAPPLTDADLGANASVSSDSFDDNTFYSSQHDTPEPSPQPQAHLAAGDFPMPDAASSQPRPNVRVATTTHTHEPALVPSPFLSRAQGPQQFSNSQKAGTAASTSLQNGTTLDTSNAHDLRYSPTYDIEPSSLRQRPGADETHAQVISSNGSGTTSRSGDTGNADLERRADYNSIQAPRLPLQGHQYGFGEPLVRAHDLSPYAPQPSHVSPLAIARQQPMPDPEISILQGAPAPIAALRQEQGNGTSPESSPQGDKSNKRRSKKKNKRKAVAEPRSAERPGSPYIKPEPRSPSPLTSPQFVRSQKRQRPLNRSQHELNYDDSRAPQPVQVIHDDPLPAPPREYGRVYDPYPREVRYSVAPGGQRLEHPTYEERRVEEPVQFVRRAQSPTFTHQYAPGEARPMRSATYSLAEPVYREAPTYQREGRMSVRPVIDRARSRSPVMADTHQPVMAPPRPPTRIFRDEYGREYLEPPRPPPSVSRYSVAPPARLADPQVIYEHAPARAATRMPGPDTFERDGVLYRRASPVPTARRVVTQPEYGASDYRDYRQRDYSARPALAPPTTQEFVQYRSEVRPQPELVPEYGMRAATVRPTEQLRYEYPARVASVRPDAAIREYPASVHPEPRREPAIPVYREYSVRPLEAELPRREYSTRPVERYYDNRPVIREDEVQFIDQPRTVQREIIYEDGRREVYR